MPENNGNASTKANKINIFKSIGNAIGSAGKATGKFLAKDNKIFGTNMQAAATGAIGAIDMIGQIGAASSYNKTANDLLQDAGKSEQDIGGVGYTVQNAVNQGQESAEVSAQTTASTLGLMGTGASTLAAAGSLLGPAGTFLGAATGVIGGAVAGLISGGAKRREMNRQMKLAELKRINQNDFNRSGALTTVLQNDLAETEGDQTQQTLYAAEGKPFGGRKQNGWGSNGEHKIEVDGFGNILSDERLGTGIDNKDTVPIHVNPNTIILPNKKVELPGGLKISPSRYYEQTGDLQGAEYATRMNIQNKKYKNGKLPGFDNGYLSNILGHGLPMLSELAQYRSIKNQDIEHNDTNVKNPYEQQALYTLGQQQENPYAIIPELYNEYAKGMYAISNAGGLGGGQRALARLTAINNLMNQSAKLQQATQAANIGHKQTWANAMLSAGAKSAENEAAARRYDLERYSRAHAAKLAGEQEARKGAWSQFMAGIKGIVDNKRYNDTMDLYKQKSKIENDYYEALTRNLLGNKVTAENSKDWSWLPEVYGPLNKDVKFDASQIVPNALQDPWSLTNYRKRQLEKSYIPQLTMPSTTKKKSTPKQSSTYKMPSFVDMLMSTPQFGFNFENILGK